MTVPPEAITAAQVKAQVAKAIRDAAFEHCGWTPSLKLCMVLYEAAAAALRAEGAAAERDRIRQGVTADEIAARLARRVTEGRIPSGREPIPIRSFAEVAAEVVADLLDGAP